MPALEIIPGLSGKLLIGSYKNIQSPVKTFSQTFFADLKCHTEIKTEIHLAEEEIGIFLISGRATLNGQVLAIDDLILVGETAFPKARYIWWNFISSSKDRIKAAAARWKNRKMGQVEGENDFIPRPNDPLPSSGSLFLYINCNRWAVLGPGLAFVGPSSLFCRL